MSDYWHKEYICPFWQAAGKKSIRCEGGMRDRIPRAAGDSGVHREVLREL